MICRVRNVWLASSKKIGPWLAKEILHSLGEEERESKTKGKTHPSSYIKLESCVHSCIGYAYYSAPIASFARSASLGCFDVLPDQEQRLDTQRILSLLGRPGLSL